MDKIILLLVTAAAVNLALYIANSTTLGQQYIGGTHG